MAYCESNTYMWPHSMPNVSFFFPMAYVWLASVMSFMYGWSNKGFLSARRRWRRRQRRCCHCEWKLVPVLQFLLNRHFIGEICSDETFCSIPSRNEKNRCERLLSPKSRQKISRCLHQSFVSITAKAQPKNSTFESMYLFRHRVKCKFNKRLYKLSLPFSIKLSWVRIPYPTFV